MPEITDLLNMDNPIATLVASALKKLCAQVDALAAAITPPPNKPS
jgi:hypothetical protein